MREPSSSSTSTASLAPQRLLTLALVLVLVAQLLAPIAGFSSVALADDATPAAATTTDATTASTDTPTPEPTLAPTDTPTQEPTATDTPTQAPAATDTPAPQPTATDAPVQPTATDAPAAQPTNPPTKTITGTPTITSDKADYNPGSTVILTGMNWQPGETVNIYVNDDVGSSWSRNVNVAADTSGNITDTFSLPGWFVADYSVTATGSISGVVKTSFTDASVSGATISMRESTCVSSQITFTSGTTVCGHTVVTVQGAAGGTGDYRIQWYAPGLTPGVDAPTRDVGPFTAADGGTRDDTSQVSAAGVWAILVCKGSGAGTCPSGNQFGKTTFTVTATTASAANSTVSANPASVPADGTTTSTITVTLKDASNNPVSGKTVTLAQGTGHSTITGGGASNASGVVTFTVKNSTAETVTYTATDVTDSNLVITQTAQVAFSKLNQTITVTTGAPTSAAYNAQFTVAATASSGLSVGYSSAGSCTNAGATFTITSGAGTCTVKYDQAGNTNYNAATQVTESVTATKAAATISLSDLSQTYNGSPKSATTSTTPSGLTVDITYSQNSQPVSAPTNAGSYAVSAAINDANYQGSTTGTLVIAKASQTITFTSTAPTAAKFNDTYTPAATGGASGNSVIFGASGACSISSGVVTMTGVGTCTVTADQDGNSNYDAASQQTQVFSVDKASATLSFEAGTLSQTYDGNVKAVVVNSSPTGLGTIAIVYKQNSTVVANPTNAGSYDVTASLSNANYAAVDLTGTLVIAPKPVTITPTTGQSKTYGDSDPTLAFTNDDGLGADAFTGSLGRALGENVGNYAINLGSLDAGSNYALSLASTPVTFAITKAALSVNANPATTTYGTPPTLTYSLSGFKFDDTADSVAIDGNASCTIAAGAGPDAGSYPNAITCDPNNLSADNYSFVAGSAGTLTINKADQTITFDQPASPAVYDTTFHVAPTSTSHLAVAVSASGVCDIAPAVGGGYGVTMTSGTGDCVLTASQDGDGNYKPATSVDRTVVAAKKDQAITFDPLGDKTYGDADFGVSATASSGLAVGFAASGNCTISGSTVHITGAGSCTVTASQAGNDNYNAAPSVDQPFSIGQKELTISGATANDKTYDGGSVATVDFSQASLVGIVGTDQVSIDSANYSASFNDKNVGVNKAVTVTGVALSGANAGNYTVAQPSGLRANIAVKGLTVTGITASDKTYDGGTAAALNTDSAKLVGAVSGDDVSLVTTSASGAFGDKTVETGKTVTVSGLTLSGTDKDNYSLTQPTTTASITAKELTISGLAASDKTYDGSDVAAITGTPELVGAVDGDSVSLTGTAAGTFDSKDAGSNKTVTVSGLSLAGADKDNYTLTLPTLTATISKAGLTISGAAAQDKVYDRTLAATVDFSHASLSGVVSGEKVTIDSNAYQAAFAIASVGNGKAVTVTGVALGGDDAGNYTVAQPSGLTANITAKSITGSFTASNKVYDGTTSATASNLTLDGVITGDTVNLSGGTATFTDKNVGHNKVVTLTGATLGGADKNNYALSSIDTTTANITARDLTVSATGVNKVYDGNASATVTLSDNRVSGDVLTDSYTSASFGDKNVGTSKPVSVSGITISGTDAGNYSLTNTTAATTADITQRTLHVTATADNKVYDGTTSATVHLSDDRVTGDVFTVSYTSASFADANVGVGKTVTVSGIAISGTDAGNYTVNTTATANANITYAPTGTTCLGAAGHAILQPINADGTSIFKQGSTVPAKFRVCDANGNSVGTPGVVASFKLIGMSTGSVSAVNETVVSTTPDTAFRWSATDQLWIFNISTSGLKANVKYTYLITLNDGSTITFTFALK